MVQSTPTAEARIQQTKVYIEMDVYDIAVARARKDGVTYSTWVRKLILECLLGHDDLPVDVVMKMLTNGKAAYST